MKKIFAIVLIQLFLVGSLLSKAVYVVSPAAKLLNQPNNSSVQGSLEKGASLDVLGEEGMYYKVRYKSQTGWVSRMYVSNTAPSNSKVNFATSLDKSTTVKARARASAYSQTASARGLTQTETLRTRGNANDYDFASIQWLESIKITDDELKQFVEKK